MRNVSLGRGDGSVPAVVRDCEWLPIRRLQPAPQGRERVAHTLREGKVVGPARGLRGHVPVVGAEQQLGVVVFQLVLGVAWAIEGHGFELHHQTCSNED